MELISIGDSGLETSRVGLGTWAIGGWMWGGTDVEQSIATIRAAVEQGITLIAAPVYGFGRSEEIVGKALSAGQLRNSVTIATKVGIAWQDVCIHGSHPSQGFRRDRGERRHLGRGAAFESHAILPQSPIAGSRGSMRVGTPASGYPSHEPDR